MTFTLLMIGLLILIPIVIGVAYIARNVSVRRRARPKNATPVPLDRNPEMPHRPGATS